MSYRNIFYNNKRSTIHFFTYDEDGEPVDRKEVFCPYIYLAAPNDTKTDAIGIDEKLLIKKTFQNEWERRKFLQTCKEQVYFNLPATQQYLLERFYDKDIRELTKNPLRTFFYDIEVIADEFPDPKDAKFPITSITIWDSLTKKYYVWGTKPYDYWSCKDHIPSIEPEEIVYEYCVTELSLLKKFVRFWRANFPDLVVGYNSYSFDMPYIVHRLKAVFDEDKPSELSPVGSVVGREQENKFKQKYIEYTIGGIAHLDYMVLYRTFTPGERESDSLDFVCWSEIKVGKLDYGDISFKELADGDWNKFINYNIWDVKLMIMLDAQKKYLDIAKFSAFSGFCNLDKAFGKTSIITGVLAKQSLQKHRIIPTQTDGDKENIPGGYVKKPIEGLYEDVVSFDANSLYPSIMITLNISPETKIGKILSKNEKEYEVYLFPKKQVVKIERTRLLSILREKGWSLSASGIIFNQKVKGVAAEFVDELYQQRKRVKDEMLRIKINMDKHPKDSDEYKRLNFTSRQLDTEQYLYKILLNSTYGAFANRFFALYDIDCAKSITTTGQAMIKQTEKIINSYIVEKYDLPESDRVVGMDTDSVLISIKDISRKFNINLIDANGDLTPEFIEVENAMADHLNLEIDKWAKDKLNSKDPRFFFKRESVCPKAIWVGKKHYILYLVNKEGEKMNKFKYSGLAIAKSTWSDKMKNISKSVVEIIMLHTDKKKADQLVYDAYDKFKELDINDVAERSSIKVLNKWEGRNNGFEAATGTTQNAKYAIWHNQLIKEYGLENKYKRIENGSRMKKVPLKDNKYNLEGVAYQNILPPEFNLEVDYQAIFFKGIIDCIKPIYSAMKWHLPDPNKQYETTLEDIFS